MPVTTDKLAAQNKARALGNPPPAAPIEISRNIEWLEPDGLGGFASGTTAGIRTRRYHALLLVATQPPTGRVVLVNGFEATVETAAGVFALSSQQYSPDVIHPDGATRIESFRADPWPQWTYRLEDGTRIQHEIFAVKGTAAVAVTWRVIGRSKRAALTVRPLVSGRDYHALHHANPAFRFDAATSPGRVMWCPYDGLPAIVNLTNGEYFHQPDWYRNFLYEQERARGLDCLEDLVAPGMFAWDLSKGEAVWILAAEGHGPASGVDIDELRAGELKRRQQFPARLHRSADDYIVRRRTGKTIVAGYPWFTDWGRDTFIALRGLCLATGRLNEAREILVEWAGAVSEGMLPNRFPDHGEQPEFNSVDASLWYIIAVHDYLRASGRDEPKLREAVQAILTGYGKGTRFNIHADSDGLLAAGQPGVQLTWMDAKVGDWVVTPRIGKPVEIQALWLNALKIGGEPWRESYERGLESFRAKFWNADGGYLYDVIDPVDVTFRPNQIFAVGGLPFPLLEGAQARQVVMAVERRLLTPVGLRSLAPGERDYRARYEGGVWERDGAYHQGTVWPWLLGPFVEAWVRVHGKPAEARARFVEPLLEKLNAAGLGHLPEVADAEAPHTPRGCPWQAWSVGELLRLELDVLR